MLGEAGGGSEWPNFAGDHTRRRGSCHPFFTARADSSRGDDPGGKAKSKTSFARRGGPPVYDGRSKQREGDRGGGGEREGASGGCEEGKG
jgi:hypothetical protein